MMNAILCGMILILFQLSIVREANHVAHVLARVAFHQKTSCIWVDEQQNPVNDVTMFRNQ